MKTLDRNDDMVAQVLYRNLFVERLEYWIITKETIFKTSHRCAWPTTTTEFAESKCVNIGSIESNYSIIKI